MSKYGLFFVYTISAWFLPWYHFAIIFMLFGFLASSRARPALQSFLFVFIFWLACLTYKGHENEAAALTLARLVKLESPYFLYLFVSLVAGLSAALAAGLGWYLRLIKQNDTA